MPAKAAAVASDAPPADAAKAAAALVPLVPAGAAAVASDVAPADAVSLISISLILMFRIFIDQIMN